MFTISAKIILCFILMDIHMMSCEENDTGQDIIRCAAELASNNFNYRLITMIWDKNVDEKLVTDFLKSYKGTVGINTKFQEPIKQTVIIVDSYQSFAALLDKLKPDIRERSVFNGAAKFLIVINSHGKKLEHITSTMWNYYVTDLVIITKDEKNRTALFTYYPYKNHLNCQNTDPFLIGYWEENILPKNLYPNKMKNMHECPLYISTNKVHNQSTEKKIALQIIKKTIIRLLRDIMNFTPIISARDYLSIDSDRAKNWSDSLNDVLSGSANISTCTIPLGVDRLGLLDYSMPYFRVRLAWLAPPLSIGPGWWRLLSPLNGYLWLLLLIVTFIVLSFPFILKFKSIKRFCIRHFRNFNKVQSTAFRIWGTMLGQTILMAPSRFRDFYIVGLWLWFTFVVRNAYQSVLIGALKTDIIVGNYANLKETVDDGYEFGGKAGIYTHFEFDPLIRDDFEIVPEAKFDDMFRDVMTGKRKFILATSLEYAFAYCLSLGKKDNECVHILPDSILTVPLVVWMKMYSPFVKSLNTWLARLIESGLLEKDAKIRTNYVTLPSSDPSPLTSHQTLSVFLCLLLGFTISIIVFFLEIIRNKSSKYVIVKKSRIDVLERRRSCV